MKKVLGFIIMLLFSLCPLQMEGQSVKQLKIISYNIWNGFENDTVRRSKCINWIIRQAPDIVAFDELVEFKGKDLKDLGKAYGHPYAALVKEEGYPVGITSRYPIKVIHKQIEGFWHGMMHVHTAGLDLILTHLSPFEWSYRLKEAKQITQYIIDHQLDSCIVLGDLNAYSPYDADEMEKQDTLIANMQRWDKEQPVYRNMRDGRFDYSVLSEFFSVGLEDAIGRLVKPASQRMSYPAAFLYGWRWDDPRLSLRRERLDYILLSPSLMPFCRAAAVHNGNENEGISDHYPVSVVLDLRE